MSFSVKRSEPPGLVFAAVIFVPPPFKDENCVTSDHVNVARWWLGSSLICHEEVGDPDKL